jgi:hypothetical protein
MFFGGELFFVPNAGRSLGLSFRATDCAASNTSSHNQRTDDEKGRGERSGRRVSPLNARLSLAGRAASTMFYYFEQTERTWRMY